MLSLQDNKRFDGEIPAEAKEALLPYSAVTLKELAQDNPRLLVFPHCLGEYGDNWENESLYHFSGDDLYAGNVVGFFGVNGQQVQIRSRFDKDDSNQYFFHYMLGRIFGINMLNWQASTNNESIWDFLPFLFPYILKRAVKQGIFRAYRTSNYNDDHIRGAIDVARHICKNVPFNGNIAYRTREHTSNNYVISLVRHTIEAIRKNHRYCSILNNDPETKNAVKKIVDCTFDYSRNQLRKVIVQNLRPIRHPFYTEYTTLQKLCLQILRHEKLTYGEDDNKVNGIVFKAEWLWEEYLNTILQPMDFKHPQPNKPSTGIAFYESDDYRGAFPDFYSSSKGVVIDAKYKTLAYRLKSSDLRNDRFQLISYVHITSSHFGVLLYPTEENANKDQKLEEEGTLRGYKLSDGRGGKIGIYGLQIPVGENFGDFSNSMGINEQKLKKHILSGNFS